MRRVSFHNLGCKVNAYETDAMAQALEASGFTVVPFGEAAEVCVINTCSVTNMADRKSRQMLSRARKQNPAAVVVAAGCYVQALEQEELKALGVDIAVGNNRKNMLPQILQAYFEDRPEDKDGEGAMGQGECLAVFRADFSREKTYEPLQIHSVDTHTRAYIKVQDGCNQFCTYCIIPLTRGRVRSRTPQEVRQEVEELAEKGVKEVVLTGIHLSSYGLDFYKGDNPHLLELIDTIQQIPQIQRIRLGSLEPRIVTEAFAAQLAAWPKVCPHFHLSLQSGSDTVLSRMNRRYDTKVFREGCQILRRHFVNPAITTDVIVGFPGETDEEFEETRKFIREIGFYELHVFKYSRRRNTRADQMPGQVPDSVKTTRSNQLMALGKISGAAFLQLHIGQSAEVLLEEQTEWKGQTYWQGYTKTYIRVMVPMEETLRRGQICRGILQMEDNQVLLLHK